MPLVNSKSCDVNLNRIGKLKTKSFPSLVDKRIYKDSTHYRGITQIVHINEAVNSRKTLRKHRFTKSESDLVKCLREDNGRKINLSKSMVLDRRASNVTNMMTSTMNLYSKLSSPDYVTIPIVGYEVMEERERFTIFKLRIENSLTRDCWLVLRRYTDFVRLNNKLKQLFPQLPLQLPKKKIFGDNFSNDFLENRKHGLQIFINAIMSNPQLKNLEFVKEFFCLNEPPTYSDNMEECKSIFEAQEETINHLKYELELRNNTIINLQQKLLTEIKEKEKYGNALKKVIANCGKCSDDINNYFNI